MLSLRVMLTSSSHTPVSILCPVQSGGATKLWDFMKDNRHCEGPSVGVRFASSFTTFFARFCGLVLPSALLLLR